MIGSGFMKRTLNIITNQNSSPHKTDKPGLIKNKHQLLMNFTGNTILCAW